MESLTEQFNYVITQLATSVFIAQHMTVLLQAGFLCCFWQLMCDLINNHTDGGENVQQCEKIRKIIIKGEITCQRS